MMNDAARFNTIEVIIMMNLVTIGHSITMKSQILEMTNDQGRKSGCTMENLEASIHTIMTTPSHALLE